MAERACEGEGDNALGHACDHQRKAQSMHRVNTPDERSDTGAAPHTTPRQADPMRPIKSRVDRRWRREFATTLPA